MSSTSKLGLIVSQYFKFKLSKFSQILFIHLLVIEKTLSQFILLKLHLYIYHSKMYIRFLIKRLNSALVMD